MTTFLSKHRRSVHYKLLLHLSDFFFLQKPELLDKKLFKAVEYEIPNSSKEANDLVRIVSKEQRDFFESYVVLPTLEVVDKVPTAYPKVQPLKSKSNETLCSTALSRYLNLLLVGAGSCRRGDDKSLKLDARPALQWTRFCPSSTSYTTFLCARHYTLPLSVSEHNLNQTPPHSAPSHTNMAYIARTREGVIAIRDMLRDWMEVLGSVLKVAGACLVVLERVEELNHLLAERNLYRVHDWMGVPGLVIVVIGAFWVIFESVKAERNRIIHIEDGNNLNDDDDNVHEGNDDGNGGENEENDDEEGGNEEDGDEDGNGDEVDDEEEEVAGEVWDGDEDEDEERTVG